MSKWYNRTVLTIRVAHDENNTEAETYRTTFTGTEMVVLHPHLTLALAASSPQTPQCWAVSTRLAEALR